MEPPRPDPPLLEAHAVHQASDAIRGYRYQLWRSVEAWLQLEGSQLLALEIAEDFDKLESATAATTTQVKDVARNITLHSPESLQAIAHLWQHQRRNPDYRLRFRFLTTASAGIEQGAPFGAGVRGIDAWRLAASSGTYIDRLRQFLRQQSLPEPIKRFLAEASDVDLQRRLLEPLEWAIEQGPAEYVEEVVRRKLALYGESQGIPPQDAADVAAHLFSAAAEVASRKTGRVLHRKEFLVLFRDKTARAVNRPEALAVAMAFNLLPVPAGAGQAISPPAYHLVSAPPPVPAQLEPRRELVTRLGAFLDETRRLVLSGSTGMGKSTLAKLLVPGGWLWAGLRWEKAVNRTVLHTVYARLDAGSGVTGVVFDDYSPEEVDEIPFGALAYRLQERGIPFIVTTSKALPFRVVTNLGLPQSCIVPVPAFSREETVAFLGASGCPAERISLLAPLLLALTLGHPQLIHARIRDLAATGWQPMPLQQLLAQSGSVQEIKAEVRTSLRQLLPEATRTLAYRLGIMEQPFRRDHALAIGAIRPAVEMPGESFELLSGPWIEQLSDDYFSVSPLLDGAAREVWAPEEVAALHRSVAAVLMKTPPLTQIEAAGSFFHAYQGHDARRLVRIAYSLLIAEPDVREAVFASLQWFSRLGSDGPLPSFIGATEGLVLRMLQYKVAKDRPQKLKIAARWDLESRTLPAEAEPRTFHRFQFTATMLMDYQARRPMEQLLGWWREMVEALAEIRHRLPAFEIGLLPLAAGPLAALDPAASLFSFVLASCASIEDLLDLAEALGRLPEPLRTHVLGIFDILPGLATSLVDRCWLRQADKPQPNWPRCLEQLGRLEDYAQLWKREDLWQAAVRARSMILNDFQHDPDAAVELLRRSRGAGGSAVLEDQEASLLQERGEHAAAWAIWRTGVSRWAAAGDGGEILLAYAAKKAAISAGYLGQWSEAARLFLDSSVRLQSHHRQSGAEPRDDLELLLEPPALAADHAYCLWRAEARAESIAAFAAAISEVETLDARVADLDRYKVLAKILEHVLLWLYGLSNLAEPYPGIASSQRITPEILSLPPTSIDRLWALLCQLESSAHGDARVLDAMRARLAGSGDRLIRSFFHNAEIGHALRLGQVEGLVPTLAAFCRAAVTEGSRAPCLLRGLFFGLLSWSHSQPDAQPPWARWRADLEDAAPTERAMTDGWLQTAQEVIGLGAGEVQSALRQPAPDRRVPFLAVRAATTSGFSPEAVFQAQVILVTLFTQLDRFYGDLVSAVVEAGWRRLLENPALLVAPSLHVPAIRQAYDGHGAGLSKGAAILLVAETAVRVRLDNSVRQTLKALRDLRHSDTQAV